jgi:serine protease AprX
MCACVAAGSKADGGVFDGVAPEATIMPCRTHFFDTELAAIYDTLRDLARDGHTVIASNSFGMKTGTPPPPPEDSDFIPALEGAISAGVHVFFSAGNYHHLAGGTPAGHAPTTIWLHKCRDDVMTVGATKLDSSMWYYSSRGAGQHFGDPGMSRKPDVVGVTPAFGRIVYGGSVRVLDEGWGTSGCCPQAAGLAALMVSKRAALGRPPLSRQDLFDTIRNTSVPLGHHQYSEGDGRLDCAAAVAAV